MTCLRPSSKIVLGSELRDFSSPQLVHPNVSQEFRMSEQGVTRWGSRDMSLVSWRQVVVTESGFRLMWGSGDGSSVEGDGAGSEVWGRIYRYIAFPLIKFKKGYECTHRRLAHEHPDS